MSSELKFYKKFDPDFEHKAKNLNKYSKYDNLKNHKKIFIFLPKI